MANDQSSTPVSAHHAQEYEKLRAELLDLSRRNPMLNYKHRSGSRQQLRFVDTALDFVLTELIEKQRTPILKPLPPPEDIPPDEKTAEFFAALSHAKANDLEYLMRLEGLNSVARQEEAELDDLDLWLRQRIREQLGLSPRLDKTKLSSQIMLATLELTELLSSKHGPVTAAAVSFADYVFGRGLRPPNRQDFS